MRTFTSVYLDEPELADDEIWWTIQTDPHFCKDCRLVQEYLHILTPINEAVIVIFDEKDNEILLRSAIEYQRNRRNPRIVEYDPDFGLSMTIDDLCKMMGVDDE